MSIHKWVVGGLLCIAYIFVYLSRTTYTTDSATSEEKHLVKVAASHSPRSAPTVVAKTLENATAMAVTKKVPLQRTVVRAKRPSSLLINSTRLANIPMTKEEYANYVKRAAGWTPVRNHTKAKSRTPRNLNVLSNLTLLLELFLKERGVPSLINKIQKMARVSMLSTGADCRIRQYIFHDDALTNFPTNLTSLCVHDLLLPASRRRMYSFDEFLNASFSTIVRNPSSLSSSASPPDGDFQYNSYPFLEVRGFKAIADFQCEVTNPHFRHLFRMFHQKCLLHPAAVFNRSIVYLDYDSLHLFRPLFAQINASIFLISSFHDHPEWPAWLIDDPRVLLWFSVNVPAGEDVPPKVVPIPLGLLANKSYLVEAARERFQAVRPTQLMFSKFDMGGRDVASRFAGRWSRRRPILSYLSKNGFPNMTMKAVISRVQKSAFSEMLIRHRFVLCPPGEGLDSYRLWESLLYGRVPVIGPSLAAKDKGTILAPELFTDLPVYHVTDWKAFRPADLEQGWAHLLKNRTKQQYDLLN